MRKIIVAGSRLGFTEEFVHNKLDELLGTSGEGIEIVSGTSQGVDRFGESWAKKRGAHLTRFPAKWVQHGRLGGYLRNMEMADYGEELIAFRLDKSKGTSHMVELARKEGLKSIVIDYIEDVVDEVEEKNLAMFLQQVAGVCHEANKQWWHDLEGQPIERNVGEMIALCHSELSEALEADRKGLKDDKLPHRDGFEVELADALIRIFDLAGGLKLDVGGALVEKMAFNKQRADHKLANRKKEGGKKY